MPHFQMPSPAAAPCPNPPSGSGDAPASPLADAHVHLQDPFYTVRLDRLVDDARAAGVARLVANATRPDDWDTVAGFALRYPGVVPFLGLHPWFVAEAVGMWEERLEGMLAGRPAGVGEIGIDPLHDPVSLPRQEEVFLRQMGMAARLGRPATIHCAGAWGRLLDLLRVRPRPERFLLHAYGGPAELVTPLADLGAWFSFGGTALLPGRKKTRRALPVIPSDRMLLETDSPGRNGAASGGRHPGRRYTR